MLINLCAMQVTIDLPEEIGQQLTKKWENLPQKVLESLSITVTVRTVNLLSG